MFQEGYFYVFKDRIQQLFSKKDAEGVAETRLRRIIQVTSVNFYALIFQNKAFRV